MAENKIPNKETSSDEIDLGQLFQIIQNGFNSLFKGFLKVFLYVKTNAIVLLVLIIAGAGIGLGLNQIISKKIKLEVIVKPQMESKNYLYDVVAEIQANIEAQDTTFFNAIGVDFTDYRGLEITINRVSGDDNSESDIKYLELLQSFEDTEAIADIVRAELQNKSSFNHRITFYYKNKEQGKHFSEKVMEYINSNPYFDGLVTIYRANAESRIKQNKDLLAQVDEIITNYSKKMGRSDGFNGGERILLDNQETVNITGLLNFKNSLIKDIETKILELAERTEPIKIINFGKPQQVQKAFYGKNIVLIPIIFLGVFFLISFMKFLNRKVTELL
ncbi:hypothetical protein ACFQZJ_00100 [Maribacter chungangensis]|uniref:Polysaccharide chain length determinant N-terminal domain-containing protein n=1 Tax=Maribacter chungangensis TaxID=1069117 RepID=A0ABW3AXV5_9FLAO